MSKRSKGRKVPRRRGGSMGSIDGAALDGYCDLEAIIKVDGQIVPVVAPHRQYDSHVDFDRRLCAAGLKRFVREIMPTDMPRSEELRESSGLNVARHVLVVERKAGYRVRRGILVVKHHEMN